MFEVVAHPWTTRALTVAALGTGVYVVGHLWGASLLEYISKPVAAGDPAMSGLAAIMFEDYTRASGLRFEHVSGASGECLLAEEMGSGGAIFDYDDDGDMDIFLVQSGHLGKPSPELTSRLFRNDGRAVFSDVTGASGMGLSGYGMGVAAADYDNDGDVDLYLTRVGPDALLQNRGDGTFVEVTAESGLGDAGFGSAAAFFDYDADGDLDLFVVRYVDWSAKQEHTCYDAAGVRDYCSPLTYNAPSADLLYRNKGDGTFEDVSASAGIAAKTGNGLGIVATDLTGDGLIDVFVANDLTPGFLWINRGDGTFFEEAGVRGCAFNGDGLAIAGMGTAADDFDGDGDFDLLVANIHKQAHLALRNDDGVFTDASHGWGMGGWSVPHTAFGLAVFDQDHDGLLDCFIGNGAVNRLQEPYDLANVFAEPNQFVRGTSGGRFENVTPTSGINTNKPGVTRGVLSGDLDNDGDIDLVVTNNNGGVQFLRNACGGAMSWIMLDLIPADGNRHALNAHVEIEAGGRVQVREVRPHTGYLGSNDPRIHVGLGQVDIVDEIRIRWPDGSSETRRDLSVRSIVTIRQKRVTINAGGDGI